MKPRLWCDCIVYYVATQAAPSFDTMMCIVRINQFNSQPCQPSSVVFTRSPAIAEGPRDAGVPVKIW